MRNLLHTSLVVLSIFATCTSFAQSKKLKPSKLEHFHFESIFGTTSTDSNSLYCLLARGFFRSPQSQETDSLLGDWIEHHPDAMVIPVSSFGPMLTEAPDSRMVYCWVIDGKDTLNNFLIRNGCFAGGTMLNSEPEKLHVSKKKYKAYVEQIEAADAYAQKNKLGVYNSKSQLNAIKKGALPEATGFINDFDEVLTPEQEDTLTHMVKEHEALTTNQITVVTVWSFEPWSSLEDYTLDLANYWRVGTSEKNNGIVIALCKPMRKIWISNGDGIVPLMSDKRTQEIIDTYMIPEFKAGNHYLGLKKGIEAIINQLSKQ